MTDAKIPGADWPGINILRTPPPTWPPLYYFGANNPPHPDLLRDANAFLGAGMGTGRSYTYDSRHPMLAALDYQWAGTYKKKIWDPLPYARGFAAAPYLSQARQGVYWRAQPVHNELGYQMVLLRDDGVPVGGEPASTPNYVFAGPIQAGYTSFVRPIMRAEQMPRVPPPDLRIPREQSQAMTGPYGGGPYTTKPLQPPGFETSHVGIEGAWPMYMYRPVAPPNLPPAVGSPAEMANTNPGRPPRKKENVMNWVSPNQVARATISNPCINPMVGSGPGYHGYLNRSNNGMPGSGPSYATMSMRNPPVLLPAVQPMRGGGSRRNGAPWRTFVQNPGCIGTNPPMPTAWSRTPQSAPITWGATRPPPYQSLNLPNPGCIGPNPSGPLQPTVAGPLGITRPWTGMRRHAVARATNPEACCESCSLGHGCEGGCSSKRASNPAPAKSFFARVATALGLAAPGTGPMASLQPGECASYSGQGGASVTCCKGKFFSKMSCFSYDYPGGQRRKIVW